MTRKSISKTLNGICVVVVALCLGACVVNLPFLSSTETPKISHAHYGHALTAWVDTPDQKGLFVVAEDLAEQIAVAAIELDERIATWSKTEVINTSQDIRNLIGVWPEDRNSTGHRQTGNYSLVGALTAATRHMLFAGGSKDASVSMATGAQTFAKNSQSVLLRAEILLEKSQIEYPIAMDALKSRTYEMRILAVQILEGDDLDADGYVGSIVDEYGLRQLRRDLAVIAQAEDPPYVPVPQKFLFGLVRLGGDQWAFEAPRLLRRYGRYSY